MPSFDNKLLKNPIIFNLRSVMEYRPNPIYALFPSYGLLRERKQQEEKKFW